MTNIPMPETPSPSPPEIPARPDFQPEITPWRQPEPEISPLPAETPEGPQGPEIVPDTGMNSRA